MNNFKRNKKALTMTEVVIVILISSVIMGVGMAMMSRSNRQFKKSNDLVNVQRLMDNILERIRSDVRSLKRVRGYTPHYFEFFVAKGATELRIVYKYDSEEKTFFRYEYTIKKEDNSESETGKSSFHGTNQIISMNFKPEFKDGNNDILEQNEKAENNNLKEKSEAEKREFKCLNVAMQLSSNELSSKNSDSTTLSIACQFCSTCVESELMISKLRELSKRSEY